MPHPFFSWTSNTLLFASGFWLKVGVDALAEKRRKAKKNTAPADLNDRLSGILDEAAAKPEPRRLRIPEDKLGRLAELRDLYIRDPAGKDHVSRLALFAFIAAIHPETKEGRWLIDEATPFEVYVEEQL